MHLGGGGGGVKLPIHFHCVLHAKRGGGEEVQKACENVYEINGRPLLKKYHWENQNFRFTI